MGSFGERLQRERQMRGISLEEIAEATKIGTRSLQALEEEKFDRLPGGIFNKGFVRAYARYLGIDEEQAVADYTAAVGESEAAAKDQEKLPEVLGSWKVPKSASDDASGEPGFLLPLIILLVLVAAILFGSWKYYNHRKHQLRNATTPPVTVSPSAAAMPAASTSSASDLPPALGPAVVKPAVADKGSAKSASTPVALQPREFSIVIHARESAWVSVVADGKEEMKGTLRADSRKMVTAHDQIILKTGNAASLEVWQNGKLLPPLGQESEVRTVTITRDGVQNSGAN